MLSLVIATVVAAPQWTADFELKPAPKTDLELSAKDAPRDAVIMPARRKATLTVSGPGTLRVRAWGLMKKAGARLSEPGKLRVWVGTVQRKTIDLAGEAQADWFVIGKPRWRVGSEQYVDFPLSAGRHEISLQHQLKKGSVGFALLVERMLPETSPAVIDAVDESPTVAPAIDPAIAPTIAIEPAVEPAIDPPIEPDPAEPAIAEPLDQEAPDLVFSPTAASGPEPGLEVTAPATRQSVSGPDGIHEFYNVAIDPGMAMNANGPGTVVVDLHAHRAKANPETLEPVVLGILLDDVLVDTLSLATPATDDFSTEGATYNLSGRVTVRVPIPLGEHSLQFTLSDNAVLGASVRPRFVGIDTREPGIVDFAATGAGLVAADATGGVLLGVLGGLWTPNAFREVGAGGVVEASLAIPVRSSRVLINLTAGFGYHDATRQIEDPNVESGQSRVRIRQTTVPLLLGAGWNAAMPASGLTVEVGIGGGAVLSWTNTRYRRVEAETAMAVAPAMSFWGGAAYDVGPGAVLARVTAVAALPYTHANVTDFDPGAVLIATGYRFDFGS